ncbi:MULTISPECIES: hypothetical protein [unclassified Microcoleus]
MKKVIDEIKIFLQIKSGLELLSLILAAIYLLFANGSYPTLKLNSL